MFIKATLLHYFPVNSKVTSGFALLSLTKPEPRSGKYLDTDKLV